MDFVCEEPKVLKGRMHCIIYITVGMMDAKQVSDNTRAEYYVLLIVSKDLPQNLRKYRNNKGSSKCCMSGLGS